MPAKAGDVRKAIECVVGQVADYQGEPCISLGIRLEDGSAELFALPRKVAHKLLSGLVLQGVAHGSGTESNG